MDRIKVCILALDALEYELVDRFYCENLKQEEYGRIDLTEFKQHSPTGEPFTPVIWSSFITGKMPDQTGITIERVDSNSIVDTAKRLVFRFNLTDRIVDALSIRRWEIAKRMRRLTHSKFAHARGVKQAWETDEEYYRKMKLKTIFDFSRKPAIVAMPAFKSSEHTAAKETHAAVKKTWERFTKGEITGAEFLQKETRLFEKEIDEALVLLKKEWDLFVFYTKTLDYVGHFFAWNTKAMWLFYERADKFIEEIENRVRGDAFILVISDHGMQRNGVHSDHAFYSTNTSLGLKNPRINDFYGIIAEKLGSE